jgi:hypothetical protein
MSLKNTKHLGPGTATTSRQHMHRPVRSYWSLFWGGCCSLPLRFAPAAATAAAPKRAKRKAAFSRVGAGRNRLVARSHSGSGYWLALLLVLLGAGTSLQAQQLKPRGWFLSDTTLLGQHTEYVLVYRHPPEEKLLFPDSTFNYAPFEYVSHRYFPTRTVDSVSVDSAIYMLTTFELDSFQRVALPVVKFTGAPTPDTVYGNPSEIYLQHQIAVLPDSLAVKVNTEPVAVPREPNVVLFGLVLLLIVIVLVALAAILYKPLLRRWRRRRLNKHQAAFRTNFDSLANKLSYAELQALWKEHLQRLSGQPVASLSTPEIGRLYPNEPELQQALRSLDRAIYAGRPPEDMPTQQQVLRSKAETIYQQKVKQLAND